MGDRIFHQDEARKRILEGAKILYEAVTTTLGPKGHNVVIGKGFPPKVTHDGVTVAKSIEIEVVDDETLGQKVGADMIKEAATRMDETGDGTTTVTVLTYHILNEANKLIAAGHSPMQLRRELEEAAQEAISLIKGEDVKGKLNEVAYISAADKEIGDMVATIVEAIGKDGRVSIERSQEQITKADVVDGFTVERGLQSPYFVMNDKGEAEYERPGILVYEGRLYDWNDVLPVIESLIKEKRPLVIFAEEVGTDVIANLVLNKVQGVFPSMAISVPMGNYHLKDIAAVTGATPFGGETGNALSAFVPEALGDAKKVISGRDKTTIVEGMGNTKDHEARLGDGAKNAKSEWERDTYQKRLSAIRGQVAVIRVGGNSESEIEEKMYRIEDAVNAAKVALEDGIVDGGGVTPLRISKEMKLDTQGAQLLKNALQQPFRILLANAGLSADAYLSQLKPGEGVNVNTLQVVNLRKEGIIDPAAVTKRAIQNAVSVAGTAMTMGALIVPIPKEEQDVVQPVHQG